MEFKEIKKKSDADLKKLLIAYRDKLRDLRFKDANKQLKNVREIRAVRKTIARIETLLRGGGKAASGSGERNTTSKK